MAECREGDSSVQNKSPSLENSETHDDHEGGKNENKMILFRKIMDKCLDKIMSTGRHSKFKNHMNEIRAQNTAAFDSITKQLMNQLRSNIETEISLMIKQEDLEYFFDTLDSAVEKDSSKTAPAWRPAGEPAADCRDHLMTVKCTYKDQLKRMLEKIEKENKALEDVIHPLRNSVEENQKGLSKKAEQIKEAAEFCQNIQLRRLQEQAKTLVNE